MPSEYCTRAPVPLSQAWTHPKWGALKMRAAINKTYSQPTAKFVFRSHIDVSHKWHKLLLIFLVQLKPTKLNWSLEPTKAWFRRRTFHVLNLNLTELVRLWSDTGATSDSEGALCVELKLSSSKVRQTLSNLTLLPLLTKTAVPDWFRRRSFALLNSSVRLGTRVERRLNRAWDVNCSCKTTRFHQA